MLAANNKGRLWVWVKRSFIFLSVMVVICVVIQTDVLYKSQMARTARVTRSLTLVREIPTTVPKQDAVTTRPKSKPNNSTTKPQEKAKEPSVQEMIRDPSLYDNDDEQNAQENVKEQGLKYNKSATQEKGLDNHTATTVQPHSNISMTHNINTIVNENNNKSVEANTNISVKASNNTIVKPNNNTIVKPNNNTIVKPNNNTTVKPNDNTIAIPVKYRSDTGVVAVVDSDTFSLVNYTDDSVETMKDTLDILDEWEHSATVSHLSESQPADTSLKWAQFKHEALSIFIISAIGINTTFTKGYKRDIKLNGWEALKHRHVAIKCCVLWKNNIFTQYPNPAKNVWKYSSRLTAAQYSCPVRGPLVDIRGVTLQFKTQKCQADATTYVRPFVAPKKPKASFAICVKIVYGNVDVLNLVHWIEYYKQLKVDKIFMFTYNISNVAETVIKHYMNDGFLERRNYDFPWKSTSGNTRDVGHKTPSVWQDEQVIVFDCFQRLSGYTYMAILDLDEFLVPRQFMNLKAFMANITGTYPQAAGFTFMSYIFVKDWGVTGTQMVGNQTTSMLERYVQRTSPLYTRQKNVILPSRVIDTSICTHEFQPKSGYERITVPAHVAAVNHYRSCYKNLPHVCNQKAPRYNDTRILKIVNKYRPNTLWLYELMKYVDKKIHFKLNH